MLKAQDIAVSSDNLPDSNVELGTHYGLSYFCFCQIVRSDALPTKCVAVDTWRGNEHAGLYDSSVFDAVAHENERYEDFSRLVRKTFAEALEDVEDCSVDILHVDGRHFYEDVKMDFESLVPKLSERAVVLFHDTEDGVVAALPLTASQCAKMVVCRPSNGEDGKMKNMMMNYWMMTLIEK